MKHRNIFGRLLLVGVPAAVLLFALFALAQKGSSTPNSANSVYISEILAKNLSGITDANGAACDWIELHNPGDTAVELTGWGLSDSAAKPYKWVFPACVMQPDEYLLIYADGTDMTDAEGYYHLPFALNSSEGVLALTAADGTAIDAISYKDQQWDIPYGRLNGQLQSVGYFSAATPGAANPTSFWGGEKTDLSASDEIEFSVPSGCYSSEFNLRLSTSNDDALILYTTDGSDPDMHSAICTDAGIVIQDREGEANQYLKIPSTAQYYALYKNGNEEVYKGTVVRARLYRNGELSDKIFTSSYFIEPPCSYPVVSLVSDPENLFGAENGITVPGQAYWTAVQLTPGQESLVGNYRADTNIPVHFEMFDQSGAQQYGNDGTARLSGGFSRTSAVKKSFVVTLSDGTVIKLRGQGGGETYYGSFQDTMLENYLVAQDIGAGKSEFCCLFVDGEYWGIYTVGQTSTTIIQERANVSLAELYLIKNMSNGSDGLAALAGGQKALDAFSEFYQEVCRRDFQSEQDLEWLSSQIDIDEFCRYIIAEVLTGNQDWMPVNVSIWRTATPSNSSDVSDGRWRWQVYDLDRSLGNPFQGKSFGDPSGNNFYDLLGIEDGDIAEAHDGIPAVYWEQTQESIDWAESMGPRYLTFTLFRKLWCNPNFRESFGEELKYECDSEGFYSAENMLDMVNAHQQKLLPEINFDLARLSAPQTKIGSLLEKPFFGTANITRDSWDDGFDNMRHFVEERGDYMMNFLWLCQPHEES